MFESKVGIWRLSLEQIEATVADHLGRGRVQGNQPGPCIRVSFCPSVFCSIHGSTRIT